MQSLSVPRLPLIRFVSENSFLILIWFVLMGLLLRLHSPDFITESLWNEDGTFITQSYELGIKSVWTPFSYIFVYHRLVALIARQMPLIMTPYIFFMGWLFSFFMIIWVLKSRSALVNIDLLSMLLVISAITLQPSQGEAWFNLNQAHFTLGIALSLYVCIPAKEPASVTEMLFLLIVSLSGVNSIVLTPILAAQLVVLKDFRVRKATYLLVTAGALAEGVFLFASRRVQHSGIDLNPADWLHVISTLLTFGGTSVAVYTTSIVFWLITLIYFVRWILNKADQPDRVLWVSPLFAAIAAGLMFFVAGVAEGTELRELNPMDMESRYCLIPYSLLFFVAFVCTKDKKSVQLGLACLAGLICALEFATVDRDDRESSTGVLAHTDMQWTAFAKFQKIKPDLVIPINSPYPIYPPDPYVQISKRDDVQQDPLILISEPSTDGKRPARLDRLSVDPRPGVDGPILSFDIGKYCRTNRYIGLEVDIWRERMGAARVYWTDGTRVSRKKSLERFYPAGLVTMQFAFRRDISDSMVDFYPALGVKDSRVVRTFAQARGADASLDPKETIAEITPAGGRVKVGEARIFCLK